MGKSLLIVESPAKARTLKQYLGADFDVQASVGHIKDLPPRELGVDVDDGFRPEYQVIRGKGKVLKDIKSAAKKAEAVYLAPDPDREGEAIAWHIAEELNGAKQPPDIFRVRFNEITRRAVKDAIAHPEQLDQHKFESQQARRILDRLVGYKLSPLLWDKVRRGLSAGRVQSVAVRQVVERERLIEAFNPEEYWTIEAQLDGSQPPQLSTKLIRIAGEKAKVGDEESATAIVDAAKGAEWKVQKIEKKGRKRRPQPPYITSRLQQEAAARFRFTATRTMRAAQQLYEGVPLAKFAGGDSVALITYMRTDSTRLSNDALEMVRGFIGEQYGEKFLPAKPNVYKSRKTAQEAHEAIRPTSMIYPPDKVKDDLMAVDKDLFLIYELVWKRFVACQMTPAEYDGTTIDVQAGDYTFRATGSILRFPGFLSVYQETLDEDGNSGKDAKEAKDGKDTLLPDLSEGELLKLLEIVPTQHFTKPPPRFTEGTLVKELEEQGIGRPSTYASILSTIQEKGYVEKREGQFLPTELGVIVTDLLVESFPNILNVEFTAQMENRLDQVEDGQMDWRSLLGDFYLPFVADLDRAQEEMRNLKREEIPTDFECERCGKGMVIRWGRNGSFLACSGYPDCRNTKEITRSPSGKIDVVEDEPTDAKCPTCEAPMVIKRGRFGRFMACSRYPECKTSQPIGVGVSCPREGCEGEIVERRSRRGKIFYGCNKYPDCNTVFWDKPVTQACPECKYPVMVQKTSRREPDGQLKCPSCGYQAQAAS